MQSDITLIICTIPPRADVLLRALKSVTDQTLQPDHVVVTYDYDRQGHAATRNKSIPMVTTKWTAFLDDDDTLNPNHLEVIHAVAEEHDADLVYPWHTIVNTDGSPTGKDLLGGFGDPFDREALMLNNYIPVTTLVRTEALKYVGGFPLSGPGRPWYRCEDWGCWRAMIDNGFDNFVHHPERTWNWYHWGYGVAGHPGNTSGDPHRW
jgi:glycosyltransferase involved in cell wall biosynthesis